MPHSPVSPECLLLWLWCYRLIALTLLQSFTRNIWCQGIINNSDDGSDLAKQITKLKSVLEENFSLYRVRTPESLVYGVERISEGDMLITYHPVSHQVWAEFQAPWHFGNEEGISRTRASASKFTKNLHVGRRGHQLVPILCQLNGYPMETFHLGDLISIITQSESVSCLVMSDSLQPHGL